MLNKDTDREHLAVETNAAGVETFALPEPEGIEEASIDALPHAQPGQSPEFDAISTIQSGETAAKIEAAQNSGLALGGSPDGLTVAEREEKKKKDEEEFRDRIEAVEERRERLSKEEWAASKIDLGDGGDPMTMGEVRDSLGRISANKNFWMARWLKEGLVKPGQEEETWKKIEAANRIVKEAEREGRTLTKEEQQQVQEVTPLMRDELKRSKEKNQDLQSEARRDFPSAPVASSDFAAVANDTAPIDKNILNNPEPTPQRTAIVATAQMAKITAPQTAFD